MTAIHGRVVGVISAAVSIVLGSIRVVSAQAWVPQQGEGSVSLAAQQLNVKKHLAGTIAKDAGHINTGVLLADVTYGLTDKFAVDLAIPFVVTKYSGTSPHPNTTIDDGTYHNSFTDFRMSVRYKPDAKRRGDYSDTSALSCRAMIMPITDTRAFGEQLNELQVGTFVAKLFTSGAYRGCSCRAASLTDSSKKCRISHTNRSMADLEAGYFLVTPSFRAFGMIKRPADARRRGLSDHCTSGLPVELRPVHDVIQRVNYVNLGAGLAYSIDDSFDLFGFVRARGCRPEWSRAPIAVSPLVRAGASAASRRQTRSPAVRAFHRQAEYARMTAKREGLARPVYLSEVQERSRPLREDCAFRSSHYPPTIGM
jgi:hypothetical protein